MPEPIHLVRYSSQPYVTIACTGVEHYVWGAQGLPEGVYQADSNEPGGANGPLYTFDEAKATCESCTGKHQ